MVFCTGAVFARARTGSEGEITFSGDREHPDEVPLSGVVYRKTREKKRRMRIFPGMSRSPE